MKVFRKFVPCTVCLRKDLWCCWRGLAAASLLLKAQRCWSKTARERCARQTSTATDRDSTISLHGSHCNHCLSTHHTQRRSGQAQLTPHLPTLLAHILQLRCHFSFTSAAPAVPRSAQSPAPPTAAPLISAERYMTSTYHVTHHSQQSAVLEVRMELHESRLCSSLSHHKSTT